VIKAFYDIIESIVLKSDNCCVKLQCQDFMVHYSPEEVSICDRKREDSGVNCVFKGEANYVEKGI